MKKIIVLSSSVFGIFCAFMYYSMFSKWEFDESGRYFDPVEGVAYNENSAFWGVLAILFLLPLIIAIVSRIRKS